MDGWLVCLSPQMLGKFSINKQPGLTERIQTFFRWYISCCGCMYCIWLEGMDSCIYIRTFHLEGSLYHQGAFLKLVLLLKGSWLALWPLCRLVVRGTHKLPPTWGNDPIWRTSFSVGLKPPWLKHQQEMDQPNHDQPIPFEFSQGIWLHHTIQRLLAQASPIFVALQRFGVFCVDGLPSGMPQLWAGTGTGWFCSSCEKTNESVMLNRW